MGPVGAPSSGACRERDGVILREVWAFVAWEVLRVPSRELVAVLVGRCRVIDISGVRRVGIGPL